LSSFPSALTVIPVPDGEIKKHRTDFIVNENLKRLGCSGRSGLNLAVPTSATQAKFYQLYKTSEAISFYTAVQELVTLCQLALVMFGKLDFAYADGLLCDVTEKAINDWWTEVGTEYFNIDPTDGILGPTTVAALLGMLLGARNRLHYYNAPVPKDPFDIPSLKQGIAYFQKSQRLPRTRRLDHQTLAQLHRVTAKAAAGEGWAVPKAVKSTVAELSGKGGDMVMGMVGGNRDKAGIGDVETLDIERFISLVHGERLKWLWHGKARRGGTVEGQGKSGSEVIAGKDDTGGWGWSTKRAGAVATESEFDDKKKDGGSGVPSTRTPAYAPYMVESPADKDQHLRKTVLKSVTGKISDARSGLGRIKDAVSLRGHSSRNSKDENAEGEVRYGNAVTPSTSNADSNSGHVLESGSNLAKTFSWKNKPEEYHDGYRRKSQHSHMGTPSTDRPRDSESPPGDPQTNLSISVEPQLVCTTAKGVDLEPVSDHRENDVHQDLDTWQQSADMSVNGNTNRDGGPAKDGKGSNSATILLRRRHSFSEPFQFQPRVHHHAWWPSRMSFGNAEDTILTWNHVDESTEYQKEPVEGFLTHQYGFGPEGVRGLHDFVKNIQEELGPWVERQVRSVAELNNKISRDHDELETLSLQLSEAYQGVNQNSHDILSEERSHVLEAVRDIEALGARLEYEVNALASKIEDVEDGVTQFQQQVEDVEGRAIELETLLKTESWLHWILRSAIGRRSAPQTMSH
jgi:hypothetical protein